MFLLSAISDSPTIMKQEMADSGSGGGDGGASGRGEAIAGTGGGGSRSKEQESQPTINPFVTMVISDKDMTSDTKVRLRRVCHYPAENVVHSVVDGTTW